MDKQTAIELIDKYLTGKASKEDKEQFFDLLEHDTAFVLQLEEVLKEQYDANVFETGPNEKLRQLIQSRLQKAIHETAPKKKAKILTFGRIAAAACIILVMGYGLWVMSERKATRQQGSETAVVHDVPAPSNTRAVITLADGSKVYLDSANNGTIAQENNVNIVKNNEGGISYLSPAGGANGEQPTANSPASYNTLSNPRGSKVISLTLSDGTKVWLNSESSLKYPIAFNSNTREVEITGEAYFEVKHNARQPFKVHLPNGSIVEDIGTAFNVNAYTDEADIKTTLIEGSVKVTPMSPAGGGDLKNSPNRNRPGVDNGVILKPGQQAVLTRNLQLLTFNPDLDQVTAWKNGFFSFGYASVETVMNQIARWYDVEIVYESRPTKIFRGSIPRDMSAAKVFKALEETGGVHFKIEGRKITVMK